MDANLFFGHFDYALFLVIIIINLYCWNKFPKIKGCLSILSLLFLFGLVLPSISMFVEIKLNSSPGDDAFNLLYTYFRFPIYWVIGLIQIIIIYFNNHKKSQ